MLLSARQVMIYVSIILTVSFYADINTNAGKENT